AFAQPGMHIDVNTAAIGDAADLRGGILLLTGLKSVDGQVYAMAQGSVVTGGFSSRKTGNTQTVNHPTAGRVPGGAKEETPAPALAPHGGIKLQLREPDFTTASRISAAINQKYGADGKPLAKPENSALVAVNIPPEYNSRETEFIATLETLVVEAD